MTIATPRGEEPVRRATVGPWAGPGARQGGEEAERSRTARSASESGCVVDRVLKGSARGKPDRVRTVGGPPRDSHLSHAFVAEWNDHRSRPPNDHMLSSSFWNRKLLGVADTELAHGLGESIRTESPHESPSPNTSRSTSRVTGEQFPRREQLTAANNDRSVTGWLGSGFWCSGAPSKHTDQDNDQGRR